jgi:excisionase family DNA binding protein
MTKSKADERAVMTVPEAGAKLGLSRNGAYEAATRGDIPTIRIGRLLRVPKVAFERMLAQAGSKSAA